MPPYVPCACACASCRAPNVLDADENDGGEDMAESVEYLRPEQPSRAGAAATVRV